MNTRLQIMAAVLLNGLRANGQLVLDAGQAYTHRFDSLPLLYSSPAPSGARPSAGFLFTLDPPSYQPYDAPSLFP